MAREKLPSARREAWVTVQGVSELLQAWGIARCNKFHKMKFILKNLYTF